jgi:hypothetical protein
MIIHNHPISWYVDKLKNDEYFSQGMYGDAEWIAIFHDKIGGCNAEYTVYTKELCDSLENSLKYTEEGFYFSAPSILKHPSVAMEGKIDEVTSIEFVEKDEPWDVQSRLGGLVPFIKQIQSMRTCIISNVALRKLQFLNYNYFIEVSYPNCDLEIDIVMAQVENIGDNCVYLISAGLPAAIIAQNIHSKYKNVFALDVGSIWDAFIGIGAQRGWRKELYSDPNKYQEWKELYKDVWDGKP